jgi:hypothetical protein
MNQPIIEVQRASFKLEIEGQTTIHVWSSSQLKDLVHKANSYGMRWTAFKLKDDEYVALASN